MVNNHGGSCQQVSPAIIRLHDTGTTLISSQDHFPDTNILIPPHQPSGDRDDVSVRKFDGLETASITQALLYDNDDDDTGAMFLEVLCQCGRQCGGRWQCKEQ